MGGHRFIQRRLSSESLPLERWAGADVGVESGSLQDECSMAPCSPLMCEVTGSSPESGQKQRNERLTSQRNERCSAGVRNVELKNENGQRSAFASYFSCFLVVTL